MVRPRLLLAIQLECALPRAQPGICSPDASVLQRLSLATLRTCLSCTACTSYTALDALVVIIIYAGVATDSQFADKQPCEYREEVPDVESHDRKHTEV